MYFIMGLLIFMFPILLLSFYFIKQKNKNLLNPLSTQIFFITPDLKKPSLTS